MGSLDEALNRIKRLECPTGEVENRVAGILEYYGLGTKSEIDVNRDKNYDKNGAHAYTAHVPYLNVDSIVVLAKSGKDDYVAEVVDAYLS
jgi:hypothetical protein